MYYPYLLDLCIQIIDNLTQTSTEAGVLSLSSQHLLSLGIIVEALHRLYNSSQLSHFQPLLHCGQVDHQLCIVVTVAATDRRRIAHEYLVMMSQTQTPEVYIPTGKHVAVEVASTLQGTDIILAHLVTSIAT